jgi:hypothetical protein
MKMSKPNKKTISNCSEEELNKWIVLWKERELETKEGVKLGDFIVNIKESLWIRGKGNMKIMMSGEEKRCHYEHL